MSSVLFVQRMIPDYRLPFFVCLQRKLEELGVEFYVTTGESLPEDYIKDSGINYPWISEHKNYYIYGKIHFHSICQLRNYDMVIVMQENSALINYYLLVYRYFYRKPLFAFFGHGGNVNTRRNKIREYIKGKISMLPDWWFAYTELSARIVTRNKFPTEKITVVNNAIDVSSIKKVCGNVTKEQRTLIRNSIKIKSNAIVGLFCGRLMVDKVSFLLQAIEKVHEKNDLFEMIVIGKGPLKEKIKEFSANNTWFHYVGTQYEMQKANYFCATDLFLMPGLIGLAILDAFAAGLPIITADSGIHSPEVEYLEDSKNGYMTANAVDSYAQKIIELIGDSNKLSDMRKYAKQSSDNYSVSVMADNFVSGITSALNINN